LRRIYIPQEDIKNFNVNIEDISNHNFTPEIRNLMKFQVDRASDYYNNSQPGIKFLEKDSRFAIQSAGKIYGEILTKIIGNDYNPFLGRVFVPHGRKIQILFSEVIGKFVNK
jgi:15-cis-phytoene synthase